MAKKLISVKAVKRARTLIAALEGLAQVERFHEGDSLPLKSLQISAGRFSYDDSDIDSDFAIDPETAKLVVAALRPIIETQLTILGVDITSVGKDGD